MATNRKGIYEYEHGGESSVKLLDIRIEKKATPADSNLTGLIAQGEEPVRVVDAKLQNFFERTR